MSSRRETDYVYNSEELLENPSKVFERIRQDGDVVWCKALRHWIVVSKAEAVEALANPKLAVTDVFGTFKYFEDIGGADLSSSSKVLGWIAFLHNGAEHGKRRALYARILTEIRTEYVRLFERSSRKRLNTLLLKGQGDFVADYADHLHTDAIGQMCEFPQSDIDWIADHSSTQGTIDFASRLGDAIDANRRVKAILDRVRPLAEAYPKSFLMQVIKRQLQAASIEDSVENQLEFVLSLIFLGGDAISGSLSIGLATMLDSHNGTIQATHWQNPAWNREELLRLSSTIQLTNRIATEPTEIGGQKIAKGETTLIFFPAANRDPKSFSCPHQADEKNGANMTFGSGRHLCTGKPMTQMAIDKAISQLSALKSIQELPGRELAQSKTVRKYKHLPISIEGQIHDPK